MQKIKYMSAPKPLLENFMGLRYHYEKITRKNKLKKLKNITQKVHRKSKDTEVIK